MGFSRVVLDTSAWSRLRAGNEEVLDWCTGAEVVYLPTIVLGELEVGFRLGRRYADNRARLDEFLSEAWVEVLPISADVALRYGAVFASLRAAGTPIPINDVWIAAASLQSGAHLLTFDGDFRCVPGLSCTVLRG